MRIGLNAQRVGLRWGGGERYAVTLAKLLVETGHEVHVFARQIEPETLPQDVTVHPVRPRTVAGTKWLRSYQFARQSERAIRREDLDLVVGLDKTWHQDVLFAVGGPHPATLDFSSRRFRGPARRAAWRLTKALSPKQWVFRVIARRQFRQGNCPHVVAPSRMSAGHFQRYHGVPERRISVIYNAVDRQLATPGGEATRRAFRRWHGVGDAEVLAAFLATNYSLKGLQPLLEAFARVAPAAPRAKLLVGGNRRDRPYRHMARRLGIAHRVLFLPFVAEVRACLAAADLLVLPSFYDPCSLVVLEAMCAGRPAITTRQNGAGELITHGQDGLVISSPWAVDELAELITRLVHDERWRRQVGQAARQTSRSLTVDARNRQILDLLEQLAAARRRHTTLERPDRPAGRPLPRPWHVGRSQASRRDG